MKQILLMGSFGAGNLGDEGILESSQKELSENFKVEKCEHFPFGFRSLLSFRWLKTIKKVAKADAVLFPGGGLFAEHESIKAILLWAWQVFCVRALLTPVYFLGQSVGPLQSKLGRMLTKRSFKKAKFIATRDETSRDLLAKLLAHKEVQSFTDTCFLFEPQQNKGKTKSIAIQLREWNLDLELIQEQIDALSTEGHELHFIATDETDLKLLGRLSGFKSVHCPQSFQELIETLTHYESAMGMRLHFLIASALAGCKMHAFSYAPKVSALMKQLEVPCTDLTGNELNLHEAKKKLSTAKHLNELHKEALAMFKALPV